MDFMMYASGVFLQVSNISAHAVLISSNPI